MQFYCKDQIHLPKKLNELEEMFFSYMEKLSTVCKRTIIILDGIDSIKVSKLSFHKLMLL